MMLSTNVVQVVFSKHSTHHWQQHIIFKWLYQNIHILSFKDNLNGPNGVEIIPCIIWL